MKANRTERTLHSIPFAYFLSVYGPSNCRQCEHWTVAATTLELKSGLFVPLSTVSICEAIRFGNVATCDDMERGDQYSPIPRHCNAAQSNRSGFASHTKWKNFHVYYVTWFHSIFFSCSLFHCIVAGALNEVLWTFIAISTDIICCDDSRFRTNGIRSSGILCRFSLALHLISPLA